MSFLKKMFGLGGEAASSKPAAPAATAEIEYNGFKIRAVPYQDRGQYQTAGEIEKVIAGETRTHRFIRADRSPNVDEATETALIKGRLMVDQQGDALFD